MNDQNIDYNAYFKICLIDVKDSSLKQPTTDKFLTNN